MVTGSPNIVRWVGGEGDHKGLCPPKSQGRWARLILANWLFCLVLEVTHDWSGLAVLIHFPLAVMRVEQTQDSVLAKT
jgi:hypothetical protein